MKTTVWECQMVVSLIMRKIVYNFIVFCTCQFQFRKNMFGLYLCQFVERLT